jgi:hypothetical protein
VKPFRDDRAIIVDLKGDPLIAVTIVEVNRCVVFCRQPNCNAKRPVCVVNEQDAAIAWRNAQDSDDFALRIEEFNSTQIVLNLPST